MDSLAEQPSVEIATAACWFCEACGARFTQSWILGIHIDVNHSAPRLDGRLVEKRVARARAALARIDGVDDLLARCEPTWRPRESASLTSVVYRLAAWADTHGVVIALVWIAALALAYYLLLA